jgi:hypothetical protein
VETVAGQELMDRVLQTSTSATATTAFCILVLDAGRCIGDGSSHRRSNNFRRQLYLAVVGVVAVAGIRNIFIVKDLPLVIVSTANSCLPTVSCVFDVGGGKTAWLCSAICGTGQ